MSRIPKQGVVTVVGQAHLPVVVRCGGLVPACAGDHGDEVVRPQSLQASVFDSSVCGSSPDAWRGGIETSGGGRKTHGVQREN